MKKLTASQQDRIFERLRGRKNGKKVTKEEFSSLKRLLSYGVKSKTIAKRSGRSRQTIRRVMNADTYLSYLHEISRWSKKPITSFTPKELINDRKISLDRADERQQGRIQDLMERHLSGSMIHMHVVEDYLDRQKTWSRLNVIALYGIFGILAFIAFKYVQ